MKKLLITMLFLSVMAGCKTMIPIKFNLGDNKHMAIVFDAAVDFLGSKGFELPLDVALPLIAIHGDRYIMQKTLGLSQAYKGWYDPETKTVHLTLRCSFKVAAHEMSHYVLHSAGIPVNLHHEIMGCAKR